MRHHSSVFVETLLSNDTNLLSDPKIEIDRGGILTPNIMIGHVAKITHECNNRLTGGVLCGTLGDEGRGNGTSRTYDDFID
jgi:hypothetical protein